MKSSNPASFSHDQPDRTGVLLANLGTPDAPTPAAVRRYLAEFLWDPRVVELPRPLWWLILHGVILRVRPTRSARKYQLIWTPDGSPLLAISQRQAASVAATLAERYPGPIQVAVGMRYGNPSIATALAELRAAGVRRLLILPLYPQYSAATVASTFDAVAAELRAWRWLPELRFITQYHDDPGYLDALTAHLRAARADQPGERLLFSFHGLPKRNLLADWAKSGVKSVDVACPGFAADCLETLEEIAIENRQAFLEAGGERYRYLPALNDAPAHIEVLVDLIGRHAAGWPEFAADYDANALAADRAATRDRALALGAAA